MSREYDYSTIEVTQWLKYLNIPFVRIDGEETYKIRKVSVGSDNDFIIYNAGKEISLNQIKSIWYRRGSLNILYELKGVISNEINKYINAHLVDEIKILEDYFYFLMKDIPHLGTYEKRGMNKLEVLYRAQNLGINIPNTYVVDSLSLVSGINNLITKCISEPFMPRTPYGDYMTYTEDVKFDNRLQNSFFPSLFQDKYEKEADLRIFYIDNNFYGMAIRSQADSQTSTDFRKYLNSNPNRKFPFNIPLEIQKKLKKLMDELCLETGSIDMIFTRQGEFIFLEVNPVGQFGMTSYPCNYYLEKKIAIHLKNIAHNERKSSN